MDFLYPIMYNIEEKEVIKLLSVISKCILFITSYIPLYVILFVQYFDFKDWIWNQPLLSTLLLIIIISLLSLIIFINYIRKQENILRRAEVRNVKKLKESNLTYLLSNIIPLIAFDFTNRQQIISFLIIFLVLLMMYAKYSLIVYNPTTELLGYTNYSADLYVNYKKIREVILLSKCKFPHQNTFYQTKGIELDNDFWMVTFIDED